MPSLLLTLASLLSVVSAQLTTSCNPMQQSCPADTALSSSQFTSNFQAGESTRWVPAAGTNIKYGANGAEFTIATAGNAPTMHTDFYIFFGYVEVTLRAAPGTGIVSSVVLSSDDLDEIDWEWLGGKQGEVQTNYFGKGDTSTYDRSTTVAVSDITNQYHTYAINWTPDYIQWLIDGNIVRTLNYADAKGGSTFPQTPCRVSLGNWAGGASVNEGTVNWAGGKTDFSQAPFTMFVKNVKIINYNPADQYTFGDRSGTWKSINIVNPGDKPGQFGGGSSGSSSTIAPTTTTTTSTTTVPSPSSSSSTTLKSPTITTSTTSTSSTGVQILPSTISGVGGAVNPTSGAGTPSTTSVNSPAATTTGSGRDTGSAVSLVASHGMISGVMGIAFAILSMVL